jgi:uncharacterized protein (TIRG00374 family)
MVMEKRLDNAGLSRLIYRSEVYTAIIGCVTIVGIILVMRGTDVHSVLAALRKMGIVPVAWVVLLAFGNYVFRILRFYYLCVLQGFRLPFRKIGIIYIAGFSMSATPGKVGEFVRMWMLNARYKLPYWDTLPIMISDRANDLIANIMLCLFGLRAFSHYFAGAGIISFIFLTCCLMFMRPRVLLWLISVGYRMLRGIKPRLFGLLRQIVRRTSILLRPRPFGLCLGLSCVGWFLECVALYLCAAIFVPQISMAQAMFVFTFANLVGAISFIPGGVGATEVSMASLLVAIGLTLEEATAVTAIFRAGTLWFGIMLGYAAMFRVLMELSRSMLK